jgi:hypothetical protein
MASGRQATIFDAKSARCEESPARSSTNQIFAFSKTQSRQLVQRALLNL